MPKPAAANLEPAAEPLPKRGHTASAHEEQQLGAWKVAHIAHKRSERDLELARGAAKKIFTDANADFVESSLGTFALQARAGSEKTDWEAIARAAIAPKKLATLVEKHTTVSAGSSVLAAPPAWGVEALAAR